MPLRLLRMHSVLSYECVSLPECACAAVKRASAVSGADSAAHQFPVREVDERSQLHVKTHRSSSSSG
jgi:hypothetical protein